MKDWSERYGETSILSFSVQWIPNTNSCDKTTEHETNPVSNRSARLVWRAGRLMSTTSDNMQLFFHFSKPTCSQSQSISSEGKPNERMTIGQFRAISEQLQMCPAPMALASRDDMLPEITQRALEEKWKQGQ